MNETETKPYYWRTSPIEIKPCLCGCRYVGLKRRSGGYWVVNCFGCNTDSLYKKTQEEAIDAWNNRYDIWNSYKKGNIKKV